MLNALLGHPKWNNIVPQAGAWTLLAFDRRKPPAWEQYWCQQREYWSADSPDKRRVQHYFGAENTEENLLREERRKYASYVEHCATWHGICRAGERVAVIPQSPDVLVLSRDWKGSITDHKDMVVALRRDRTLGVPSGEHYCELYTYGTLVTLADDMHVSLGLARPGKTRITNRRGSSDDKRERVSYDRGTGVVRIGDALFKVEPR